MMDTATASTPLSINCQSELLHGSCTKSKSAWDYWLDRQSDCLCQCHND